MRLQKGSLAPARQSLWSLTDKKYHLKTYQCNSNHFIWIFGAHCRHIQYNVHVQSMRPNWPTTKPMRATQLNLYAPELPSAIPLQKWRLWRLAFNSRAIRLRRSKTISDPSEINWNTSCAFKSVHLEDDARCIRLGPKINLQDTIHTEWPQPSIGNIVIARRNGALIHPP